MAERIVNLRFLTGPVSPGGEGRRKGCPEDVQAGPRRHGDAESCARAETAGTSILFSTFVCSVPRC
jgi:hypothetical protein